MALTAAEIADIRRYAQELVDHAPPLTPKQRDRLQALLRRKPTESKPIAPPRSGRYQAGVPTDRQGPAHPAHAEGPASRSPATGAPTKKDPTTTADASSDFDDISSLYPAVLEARAKLQREHPAGYDLTLIAHEVWPQLSDVAKVRALEMLLTVYVLRLHDEERDARLAATQQPA
ncbi:hypothetical protein ACFYO0_26775 [Streptomyces sp. NPDC006365]|uniref:hypothetical protein n=1 Tax=Streptomyces sp. NPDC006365 TaxID=3364744 RepID=UPI003690AEDD